ncbi:MAG TPA: oxidoreductase [Acidimicrobiales bacterium]|jgi:aryl-alcohol dehydrogenase-like predicted oxidoreductase|nr:oxidoreductase [Acidimicrobiales bacterium]
MNTRELPAAAAGSWELGDVTVNRIGFGAMRLASGAPFSGGASNDRAQSIAVLRRAVELGVNHVDTAAFYFTPLRSANELINRALAPYPEDLVITTKVGPGRDPWGQWTPRATPEQLRGQVEENIRQLGLEQLDVVNLRVQDKESVAEHFGALADLRSAGLIRNLGVSEVTLEQLDEARSIAPVVCVQNRYGIDQRRENDELLRICGERGIAFVPFFAISGSSQASGAPSTEREELVAIAEARGVTPAQVRLAWTLLQGSHVLAIPGTGRLAHLEENVAAGGLRFSEEELAVLDSIG